MGRCSVADAVLTSGHEIRQLEQRHSSGGVPRRDVVIVRGHGSRLYSDDGRSYIDLGSAHGWANLGHNHPDVTRQIQEQAGKLVSLTESGFNDQRARWFERLTAILTREIGNASKASLSRVVPCNSGTEAIECAVKVARYFTGRTNFVAFRRGFHGRTLGALSATANPKLKEPFGPLVPGFTHVPFNKAASLDTAVDDNTAAVIVELVQGEGGVHVAHPEFVAQVRELCDQRGALLIVDEIQTGFGRTGRWFACQHYDLQPDIIALGKSLGGGIPMGATVWRDSLGTLAPGAHGSTFGGGPLACAASIAMFGVLEEQALVERAARLGQHVIGFFKSLDARIIREVRGVGMMIGIELRTKVASILMQLMEQGVWALPAGGTVLRLLPPLTIEESDLDRALHVVGQTLRAA